jgi:hypothetical protein
MHSVLASGTLAIVCKKKTLPAAKCRKCGAKIYPRSLLTPHLDRHQRNELWFSAEVNKLRHRFSRMREIA